MCNCSYYCVWWRFWNAQSHEDKIKRKKTLYNGYTKYSRSLTCFQPWLYLKIISSCIYFLLESKVKGDKFFFLLVIYIITKTLVGPKRKIKMNRRLFFQVWDTSKNRKLSNSRPTASTLGFALGTFTSWKKIHLPLPGFNRERWRVYFSKLLKVNIHTHTCAHLSLCFCAYKYMYIYFLMKFLQSKGIWKQDPEANIWAQEAWEWRMEKTWKNGELHSLHRSANIIRVIKSRRIGWKGHVARM